MARASPFLWMHTKVVGGLGERPENCPHPHPLPQGEGKVPACANAKPSSEMVKRESRIHPRRHAFFPLPAGEGWGEGQSPSSFIGPPGTVSDESSTPF